MDYTIGIGVTTFNRPEHFKLWKKQLEANTHYKYKLSVADQIKGIANAKNYCLRELRDCDYIFLFDDDCFPIAEGWEDCFIRAYLESGNHHFMYLNDSNHLLRRFEVHDGFLIDVYKNCGGCFMFLTKTVIEKVGGYYTGYGQYGFEHAGYTHRIHQAGLTRSGAYLCPSTAPKFLHSLDLDLKKFDIKHKPSLPITTVIKAVEENKKAFEEDVKEIYRPIL